MSIESMCPPYLLILLKQRNNKTKQSAVTLTFKLRTQVQYTTNQHFMITKKVYWNYIQQSTPKLKTVNKIVIIHVASKFDQC